MNDDKHKYPRAYTEEALDYFHDLSPDLERRMTAAEAITMAVGSVLMALVAGGLWWLL